MKIIQSPSPNFSGSTHKKIGVHIHKTLGLMPGTLEWLRNPVSQASSHFLITKNGTIHQLVDLSKRAWAAGRISHPSARARKVMKKTLWGSYVKPGHYLVQIEVECLLNESYTESQYRSIVNLYKETFPFSFDEDLLLTHRDTAIDKPPLEVERDEIIKRMGVTAPPPSDDREVRIQKVKSLVSEAAKVAATL